MSEKPRIGYIGVGLMGHGAAKNILERGGYALTIMANRNRQPVDDLVGRGAVEAGTPAAVAEASDVVFLCLPSSVEVEAIVNGSDGGPEGLASAMRPGMILVDSTTADPAVTRRIGRALAEQGVAMVDAALGRTPKEAEEGRLSTYVGGDPEVIEQIRPILESYADTIVVCGGIGAGTIAKLVNNSIAIGTCGHCRRAGDGGQARFMLEAALLDPNPVLIFEHVMLYNDEAMLDPTVTEVDIATAKVRREGMDVTLVTYGGSLKKCLAAAVELGDMGITTEVIDLRVLRPLDMATVIASVRKTHRCVIVDEGWRTGSLSAEIGMRLAEEAFFNRDAPLRRVCTAEVPIPYAPQLEDAALPQVPAIVAAAQALVGSRP